MLCFKARRKVSNYIICIFALHIIVSTPILGQEVDLNSDQKVFIQPTIGIEAAFFYPSDSRVIFRYSKDMEEFFTYGIGVGYDWKKNEIKASFSLADDVDAWDTDQSSLPRGYRYFNSYLQAKLSIGRTFFDLNFSEKRKISFSGDAGILFRKYDGRESLGPSENFRIKNIAPTDFLFSISSRITFDLDRPIELILYPLGINFGFEATTYEVPNIGFKYRF